MAKEKIEALVQEYMAKEKEIYDYIAELPSCGGDCDCDGDNQVEILWREGEWLETHTYCLDCGGAIWNREMP
jgi:hypothetical protein